MTSGERRSLPGRRHTDISPTAAATFIRASEEMRDAAADLVQAATLTRRQRTGLTIVTLLSALAALASSVGVLQLLRLAQTNRDNTTATRATADAIKDCTTPTGECYRRSQASTADAISVLQRYTLIAVECAHEPSDAAIEACVARKSVEQGLVK